MTTGKDTSGNFVEGVEKFNALGNGVTVKLLEQSTSADEQRARFVQRQEAKYGECDIFQADVIWTAEFLELAIATGGTVLSPDGKQATIDSPENLAALRPR